MLAPHHHHQEPVEGTPTASQPTAANADNATRGGADDVRAGQRNLWTGGPDINTLGNNQEGELRVVGGES